MSRVHEHARNLGAMNERIPEARRAEINTEAITRLQDRLAALEAELGGLDRRVSDVVMWRLDQLAQRLETLTQRFDDAGVDL